MKIFLFNYQSFSGDVLQYSRTVVLSALDKEKAKELYGSEFGNVVNLSEDCHLYITELDIDHNETEMRFIKKY